MITNYIPTGTCSQNIRVEVDNGIIKNVVFTGGCPGNLLGISKLVISMKANDVIAQFDGLRCGGKKTSCPDQLAQALKNMQK